MYKSASRALLVALLPLNLPLCRSATPSVDLYGDALPNGAIAIGAEADTGKPTIKVWEVATGQLRKEFVGHTGDITSLAFSDDGRLLASGSRDTTVLVWDLR